MNRSFFESDISERVWKTRYCLCEDPYPADRDIDASWHRVAQSLASLEDDPSAWSQRFYSILRDFKFLPGGRILAGVGSRQKVTLFNCFVMGRIEDSDAGIQTALEEAAMTMQQGGGVGFDFSTLHPGDSGLLMTMQAFDRMCATLLNSAPRRGAMMGTLRCDHPDIESFIDAKRTPETLSNFNLSVLISDAFMQAVKEDADWPLIYPEQPLSQDEHTHHRETIARAWSGAFSPENCRVFKHIPARDLWQRIMRANYDSAEPGVLFIDRINDLNNLAYREQISATNPCGEVPLPYYGACDLGSINLTRFVREPFTDEAFMDLDAILDTVTIAVRLLDNVIDQSRVPLEAQREQAQGNRRIGLGITGLADSLILLDLHYDSEAARTQAAKWMQTICHTAYRSSIALAQEKGPFPFFEKTPYLASSFIQTLPEDVRHGIAESGIRNSHLTAIAPSGTISLLANNVSSGIEPVFRREYQRKVREADGNVQTYALSDYAYRLWRSLRGDASLPDCFIEAADLTPEAHLGMQAALQPYVDNAISKTINVAEHIDFDDFSSIYEAAHRLGLKGCTTFRPNPLRAGVLES